MKNIGEKLEQARNARGISLKDAVMYTKIKQEFLVSMEKNDFSFNLPDVYKRGFLRLYADYLKLNPTEIMQDYKAMQGEIKNIASPDFLNKITEKDSLLSNEALNNVVSYDNPDATDNFDADKAYFDGAPSPLECDSKLNYIKIALIASSIFLGILILFFLFRSIMSSSKVENPELSDNINVVSPLASSFILTLSAKPNQDTYVVLYYEGQERNPIYTGPLNSGEKRDFEIEAPYVWLNVSDIERLVLSKNAEDVKFSPSITGIKTLKVTAP